MFSYLRVFSLISAVIVLIAAVGLGYYFRRSAAEDMSDLVIKNNQVLVQGYINQSWKNHPMVKMLKLFDQYGISMDNWEKYRGYKENFEAFSRDTFRYFEAMPVVHVAIYDTKGNRLLSLAQSGILGRDEAGIGFSGNHNGRGVMTAALKGSSGSDILENVTFPLPDGSRKQGVLVQTAIPIFSDNYVPLLAGADGYDKQSNIEGVVEIYYDISRQWDQLFQFQLLGSGTIILIFFLLLGTLVMVAGRAERIITRQHDTNLELAAQAAAAEAQNENKSKFLASISHELRTPLNAIIGFSDIIKSEAMGPMGNPQYADYIKDIHNSGVHLLSLINDILDYSKAEAGKLEVKAEQVDITKLIHASMRLIAPRAEIAKVKLVTEVPSEHYTLLTDGKKVKQILLNLLSNAVKFTPEGGFVQVTLWKNVMDNAISVEVKDSGIGIAPKDISKALSPFGQIDNALSRKYEGTGLGLPLTKRLIEILGGNFDIQSEVGKGTAVRFTLPITSAIHNPSVEELEKATMPPSVELTASSNANASQATVAPHPSPISAPPPPAPSLSLALDYPSTPPAAG